MKTIKALEPITAYGPDKLMLFVGETAEIEDSFAQQLIDEGKAEEFSGGGSSSESNIIYLGYDSSMGDPWLVYHGEDLVSANDILRWLDDGKQIIFGCEGEEITDSYGTYFYKDINGILNSYTYVRKISGDNVQDSFTMSFTNISSIYPCTYPDNWPELGYFDKPLQVDSN